jgi:hypothetical protein
MKTYLLALGLVVSLPTFAHVQKLKCSVGNQKNLDVIVTGPQADEKPASITYKDILMDEELTVTITASYNGVSSTLKPGSSGNYSVQVDLEKKDSRNPKYNIHAAALNFTTTFPYSTSILYTSSDEADEEVDMAMLLVKCLVTK